MEFNFQFVSKNAHHFVTITQLFFFLMMLPHLLGIVSFSFRNWNTFNSYNLIYTLPSSVPAGVRLPSPPSLSHFRLKNYKKKDPSFCAVNLFLSRVDTRNWGCWFTKKGTSTGGRCHCTLEGWPLSCWGYAPGLRQLIIITLWPWHHRNVHNLPVCY